MLVEVIRGRYGEAVDARAEVHELFRRTRPVEAEVFAFAQRLTIGHDLGGLREDDLLAPTTEGAIGFALALQLYSAILLFDLDRRDEAIARIPHRRGEVPDRPSDYVTVFIDVAAAHVAAEVGDLAAVPALLDRLAPMAGRWANGGTGAGSLGLVDLAIARLHATAGNVEQARELVRDGRSTRTSAWERPRGWPDRCSTRASSWASMALQPSIAPPRSPTRTSSRSSATRSPRPGLTDGAAPRIRQGVVARRGRIVRCMQPNRITDTATTPNVESYLRVHRALRASAAQLAEATTRPADAAHPQGACPLVPRVRRRDPVPPPHRGRAAVPRDRGSCRDLPRDRPEARG